MRFNLSTIPMSAFPVFARFCFFLVIFFFPSKLNAISTPRSQKVKPNIADESRRCVLALLGIANNGNAFPALALSPSQASADYDKYAKSYDDIDGGEVSSLLGLDNARAELFGKASGKVLEVGVGTGLNLAKYDPKLVSDITVVDISEGMIEEARSRVKALNLDIPIKFVKADATSQLREYFGSNAFDTVVDSFSLCVMGNEGAKQCLDEMSIVLKPEGRLLLLENSRSSSSFLGWYQDATALAAASAGGKGCVYNQDVSRMIKQSNRLKIIEEKEIFAGVFRAFECVKMV